MFVPLLLAFTSLAEGENCPAGVDVEARVREILHLTPERELTESFLVERHEAGLYVVLKSADSTTIGERTLPTQGSCDDLAQAAAVVLSAWLTDVHPDFAGALPPAPPPEPEPEPEPPAPEPKPLPLVKPPPPPPPPAPPPARRFEASLGVAADLAGGAFAPAGLAGLGYYTRETGVGLGLSVFVDGTRSFPLGSGDVTWRRWPLCLGPTLRLAGSSLTWDVSAGPTLSWLSVSGHSFAPDRSESDFIAGGFVSARLSGAGPTWRPFGQLALLVWPGEFKVYASVSEAEQKLPQVAAALSAGVTLVP